MENKVYGYKGFNEDWTCRNNFQYEVGKTYEMEDKPVLCARGFHFCTKLEDVFNYYKDKGMKLAKVIATGDTTGPENDSKVATNKLTVLKEIKLDDIDKDTKCKLIEKDAWMIDLFNNLSEDVQELVVRNNPGVIQNINNPSKELVDLAESLKFKVGETVRIRKDLGDFVDDYLGVWSTREDPLYVAPEMAEYAGKILTINGVDKRDNTYTLEGVKSDVNEPYWWNMAMLEKVEETNESN